MTRYGFRRDPMHYHAAVRSFSVFFSGHDSDVRWIAAQNDDTEMKCENSGENIVVTIKKPLGLVLEENPDGMVIVAEVVPGGNADKAGANVKERDIIVGTSAVVLKKDEASGRYEKEGYGDTPYTNWETIYFDCVGQSFDTVMAAIGSNNERWGYNTVTLTLRRPQD